MIPVRILCNFVPVEVAIIPAVFDQHHIRLFVQHIPLQVADSLEQRVAEARGIMNSPLQLILQQGNIVFFQHHVFIADLVKHHPLGDGVSRNHVLGDIARKRVGHNHHLCHSPEINQNLLFLL
ncbi:hypothetical protein D3C76_1194140 [compost metagenome]